MPNVQGDYAVSSIVYVHFNTHKTDGTPITLAGTPAVSVYKDDSTTESTAGVTLTVDLDSRTGMHCVKIDTSADGTFYASGHAFKVVVTTGTVNAVSVVGVIVGAFTLEKESALRPTTAGRTLDVSAGGEAGLDWANVGSPTTTLGLTGTTLAAVRTTYAMVKNGAFANFTFAMTDSVNHLPATGLTVTCQRSIDGAAFANCATATATEVAYGIYKVNLAAADLNGNMIVLRFTATGADDRIIEIITQS